MAITMNQVDALKTLNAFKDFATSTRQGSGTVDSIIHYEQAEGFSVDERDRIRGLLTWSSPHRNVDANNATRNTFKEALLALFDKHDLSELPRAVQKKLKAGDFDGTGKPLSVRRIQDIMTVVADTAEYKNTTEYAAMKAFADRKLGFDTPRYQPTDNKAEDLEREKREIVNAMVGFCDDISHEKDGWNNEGGHLNDVIRIIGKGLSTGDLEHGVEKFFAGIKQSLWHMAIAEGDLLFGDFGFMPERPLGDRSSSEPPKVEWITVKRTGDVTKDLDDFFAAFKNHAETRFRDENRNADAETVNTAVNAVFEEVKKLVDQLKIRMGAMEQSDNIPGETAYDKIKNFPGHAMERQALEVE